jgi:hypothetical protein
MDASRSSRAVNRFTIAVVVLAVALLTYNAIRSNDAWGWGFFALSLVVLAALLALSRRRGTGAGHPGR